MRTNSDRIRPLTHVLAAGFVLAITSIAVSEVPFDRTGLNDAYTLDPTSASSLPMEGNRSCTRLLRLAHSINPSEWKHEQLTGDHRVAHVVGGAVTSICLLATSAALLLLFKKSHSPSIASLLKLLCVLMAINGFACLFHVHDLVAGPSFGRHYQGQRCLHLGTDGCNFGLETATAISFQGRASLRTAETELRQSKECFERALEGSSNGLWEWNIEAGEVWYARRFRELLGYTDEEFPDELASWESRLHPDDRSVHAIGFGESSNKRRGIRCRISPADKVRRLSLVPCPRRCYP